MASLREVFDALVGEAHPDPGGLVRDSGFDLSEAAATDALVNYAHSAPVEVAEHLAGFVTAHSPVPGEPAAAEVTASDGLTLLTTAPVPLGHDPADLDEQPLGGMGSGEADDGDELDFGSGRIVPADEAAGTGAEGTAGDPAADDVPFDGGVPVPLDSAADALDFGTDTGFADPFLDTGHGTASGLDDDADDDAGAA
jgi:hypothetical protein